MRPNVGKAVLGGVIGTTVFTAMMYMVAPMMGVHMDVADMLSHAMKVSWTMGMILHFMNGVIVFPLIYAFVVYPLASGSPPVRGIIWGVVLWLLLEVALLPMMGMKFFGPNMRGATASLINHIIYGAILGAIAGLGKPGQAPRVGQRSAA